MKHRSASHRIPWLDHVAAMAASFAILLIVDAFEHGFSGRSVGWLWLLSIAIAWPPLITLLIGGAGASPKGTALPDQ